MISKDNTRVMFVIQKEKKEKLMEIAQKEGRTMSNLINKIIEDYIRKHESAE